MAKRPIRRFLIRLVIGLSVLAFLIARIGWEEIFDRVSAVHWVKLLLPLGFVFAEAALRAYNWWSVLRVQDAAPSLLRMLYVYSIGAFLGGLVPSSVGSDVVRATTLAKRDDVPPRASVVSVTMISIIDMLSAGILLLIGAPIVLDIVPIALIVAAGLLVAGAALHFLLRGRPHVAEWIRKLIPVRVTEKVNQTLEGLAAVNSRLVAIRIFFVGFLSQVADVLIAWGVAWAFDVSLSFMHFVAFVPVVLLARVLPISFARFGGEQLVFVALFTQVGVPSATAFTLSIVISLLNSIYLLFGGALYLARSSIGVANSASA